MDISQYISFTVITLLGLFIKFLWSKIRQIPTKEDIKILKLKIDDEVKSADAVISGIKLWLTSIQKEDSETKARQWTEINKINDRLGRLEGMIEGIQIIIQRGLNGK
jgi:hypothetical protein